MGWSRPQPDMEVIPEIPRYEYLELKRFKQFSYSPYKDKSIMWSGKWKVSRDTLLLVYKKSSRIDRYVIKPNGYGVSLQPMTLRGESFSRLSFELDDNSMKKRVYTYIHCYDEGTVKVYGKLKKYAEGDRNRPILRRHGNWRFYNKNGILTNIIHYRKGEEVRGGA